MDNQELIWVDKEFAERYKKAQTDLTKRDEQVKVFEEYLSTISEKSRREFKANLESMEEDAAIYTGLMLKVKQAFEKAKNEALNSSYELWEKFENEMPSIKTKTDKIIKEIDPLVEKLKTVNELLGKISTYDIDRFISIMDKISSLYGNQKEMIHFLMNNFKKN